MANVSPIADLTYRNYDGPLDAPQFRWWVIAKAGIRKAVKNRWVWASLLLSSCYYGVMIVVFFIVDQIAQSAGGGGQEIKSFMAGINWTDQFLHGFSFGQIWYLAGALLLGAGAVANDNRANALLVYLSKPCTKADYLFGKWVGVFIPILFMMLGPALLFYAFGVMSYRDMGFLKNDPWLIVKILVMMPLGAAFLTSVVIGVSSLFRQGWVAGAAYAGLYFITNIFTVLIGAAHSVNAMQGGGGPNPAIWNLFYASIDGVEIGIAKAVLHTNGTPPFGMPRSPQSPPPVPAPSLAGILAVAAVICAICLFVAWKRIRAVEVVR